MYNAYMIRNDGKEIPVKIHPYGNPQVVEETIYASQWLYRNTAKDSTKNLIVTFIKSFAIDVLDIESNYSVYLWEWQSSLPYVVFEKEFLDEIADRLVNADSADVDTLNQLVCDELNQEFLRARFGGLVNSSSSSSEMVFRVSSVGFNWFNIIYMFVYNHKAEISSVTIVKDEEALGVSDYYYEHKNEVYNQLPIDTFLVQSGNPVVESLQVSEKWHKINMGCSLIETFGWYNMYDIHNSLKYVNNAELSGRETFGQKGCKWQKVNH